MGLRWEPHLATGHAEVDAQHQGLFNQVSGLLEAMHERRGAAEVAGLLDFLGRYAAQHFALEERLMAEACYPGLEPHRQEHLDFVRDFTALCRDHARTGPTPAVVIRLNVWLCGWLRRHVSDTDQAMARYLAERKGP